MDLVLVRHGLPHRVEGADGAADPELSEIGHAQSERLAEFLAPEGFDAIYSSPMRRARQTAAPTARALGLEPIIEERIAESDQRSSSYVPAEQAKKEGGNWRAGWSRHSWPDDYEPFDVFHQRVNDGIDAIIDAHPDQRVIVFCHAGVIARYLNTLLDGPPDEVGFFYPLYTSYTRVVVGRSGKKGVISLNETGHLTGTDLPTGRLR